MWWYCFGEKRGNENWGEKFNFFFDIWFIWIKIKL